MRITIVAVLDIDTDDGADVSDDAALDLAIDQFKPADAAAIREIEFLTAHVGVTPAAVAAGYSDESGHDACPRCGAPVHQCATGQRGCVHCDACEWSALDIGSPE